jgi:hypothetical protein
MAGRIKRGTPPRKKLRAHNYRALALPYLRRDFKDRCAYSMQHLSRAGGLSAMEIDHHDASLRSKYRHQYSNLFLSTRHCNLAKRNKPTKREKRQGKRFLNPCLEQDYDSQLFEDPRSHEIWGTTIPGKYHVIYCDLNAPHFVRERRRRTAIRKNLGITGAAFVSSPDAFFQTMQLLREEVELMIPEIEFKLDPTFS